ncbi:MAG: DUF3617 family protein [Rhodanobacter sp.]
MNKSIQNARRPCRGPLVRRRAAFGLFIAIGLGGSGARADPADFQAMPGLWRTVVTVVDHGRPGHPSVRWHCVHEGADPWLAFADLSIPEAHCQRADAHRSSTALAWTVSCSGRPSVVGRGRVDFDSAEHYTASIVLQGRGEAVRVEGKRYAACTDPTD